MASDRAASDVGEPLRAAWEGWDLVAIPCWRLGPGGECRAVNRAWRELTGASGPPREAWPGAVHPEDLERVGAELREGISSGQAFALEYRLRTAGGSHRWIVDRALPAGGDGGEWLVSGLDDTRARAAEARAARLGSLYGALARMKRVLGQESSPVAVFDEACRIAVETGHFQVAWVGLLDPVTRLVIPTALAGSLERMTHGELWEFLEKVKLTDRPDQMEGQGLVGPCCREGRPMVSNDIWTDERLRPWWEAAEHYGMRSSAIFPLKIRGRVRGVFALYFSQAGAFDPEVLDLLARLSEEASLALERLEQAQRWSDTEARFRRSERLFGATLDNLTAAIAILDENGTILAMNAAWTDFRDPSNLFVHGLGPGGDYAALCASLRGGGPLGGTAGGIADVLRGGRKAFSGEYMAGSKLWYASRSTRFEDGGFTRTVVAHREITGRKDVEERLRQSETLFRLITENAVDLIALTEADGRRLYASPSYQTVLGVSGAELDSAPLEVVHPEDRERVKRTFQLIAGQGFEAATTEYRMQRKDGTYSLFEARLTAIRDPAGAPTRILVVARDISAREAAEKERQRMEVQLRHAQKLESIGHLAAGVAHEINTPTQYIGDNLRFIHDAFKDVFSVIDEAAAAVAEAGPSAGRGLLRIAQRSEEADLDYLRNELPKAIEQSLEGVSRVAKIVGAMKAFSHPGGEDKAPADLNHAIESTITVSRNEWKYVADLVLDLDRDLPEVPCLLGEINQVVLNLIVNAAHAISDTVALTGKKGTITVRTRQEEGWVAVEVGDTGGGIPEAIRGRVFDPFFTTKEVGRGSGQGLSIAHSVVVDKHGGTIHFESEEGRGTVFTFRLPLAGKAPKE